jgi:hypothetical protein
MIFQYYLTVYFYNISCTVYICFDIIFLLFSRSGVKEYAGPRADHDRAGPEYRYLDRYATANTDYV